MADSAKSREKIGHKTKAISNTFDQVMNSSAAALDITSSQSAILGYLVWRKGEPVYQRELERRFHMKHPTLVGILKRMEEKGFVYSTTDETDHRLKLIYPTQKAIDLKTETARLLDEAEEQLLTGLSEEEITELHRLLDKVILNLPPRHGHRHHRHPPHNHGE